MGRELARQWMEQFFATLGDDREAADRLRESAIHSDLTSWTGSLTDVVVRSFEQIGLRAVAKGHRCTVLPVKMSEYLGQDVIALPDGETGWRFPVAVCELENASDDDRVAYSLWKVLCIRCQLRVVFCYRPGGAQGVRLVAKLTDDVVSALSIQERTALGGDSLVVVGSRNEAETFPYGFFHAWRLNTNTGRFEQSVR